MSSEPSAGGRVLVVPWGSPAMSMVNPGNEVILAGVPSTVTPEELTGAINSLKSKDAHISVIGLTFRDFRSFLSSGIAVHNTSYDVAITEPGVPADFMPLLHPLTDIRFRFILPLRNNADRRNIKILTSSGVKVTVDLRDKTLDWAQLDDLVTDQLLPIAPRAALEPVAALATDKAGLAAVYYADTTRYSVFDAGTGAFAAAGEEQEMERLAGIMASGSPCAFCEGFRLCRSFLAPYMDGNLNKCRSFFASFNEAQNIAITKNQASRENRR